MFHGPFALLERSLRMDSKSKATHLFRLAIIGFAYFNFFGTSVSAWSISAPGLHFFSSLAYLDIFFISLFGIGWFSTTITEEKEENTLGLLLMTGINPVGILIGKLGARFCQVASLLLIQLPLMLLCVTLGGIMINQIWAAVISLFSFLTFVAGLGLLSSTISKNGREAGAFVIFGLIVYFVSIPLVQEYLRPDPTLPYTNWEVVGHLSVLFQINQILTTGFSGSPWCPQVFFEFGMGLFFGLLSWVLFGYVARNPTSDSQSERRWRRWRLVPRFPAGRAWDNAIAWKDFQFVAGGIPMMVVRTLFYLGIGIVIWISWAYGQFDRPVQALSIYLAICALLWPIDLAISWSHSMEQEVQLQTVSSLTMLPYETKQIIHSKLAGAALGSLPGLCVLAVLSVSVLMTIPHLQADVLGIEIVAITVVYLLTAMLFPSYAAVLALYMRWGSVAATVGLMLFTGSFIMSCIGAASGSGSGGRSILMFWMGGVLILIHFFCYDNLLFRFRELAEK